MKPSSLLGIHALHGMEKIERRHPFVGFVQDCIGYFEVATWDNFAVLWVLCLLGGSLMFVVVRHFLKSKRIGKTPVRRSNDEESPSTNDEAGSSLLPEKTIASFGRQQSHMRGYQRSVLGFWTRGVVGKTKTVGSKSDSAKDRKPESTDDQEGDGCFLTYETDSGGRLMLKYQKGGSRPMNAVGFWAPGKGKTIQDFKFKKEGGKSELIKGIAGGDANRRKYFAGWCQFLKLARAINGKLKKFSGVGVDVDVYGFNGWESRSYLLNLEKKAVDISKFDAVAVVPRHKDFLQGVNTLPLSAFLQKGAIDGSSTMIR